MTAACTITSTDLCRWRQSWLHLVIYECAGAVEGFYIWRHCKSGVPAQSVDDGDYKVSEIALAGSASRVWKGRRSINIHSEVDGNRFAAILRQTLSSRLEGSDLKERWQRCPLLRANFCLNFVISDSILQLFKIQLSISSYLTWTIEKPGVLHSEYWRWNGQME